MTGQDLAEFIKQRREHGEVLVAHYGKKVGDEYIFDSELYKIISICPKDVFDGYCWIKKVE